MTDNAPSGPAGRPAPSDTPSLSLTQVVASTLAAITATAALSLFGVAGTVVGAGLASMLTVVGNHLYTRSLTRTRERVRARIDGARGEAEDAAAGGHQAGPPVRTVGAQDGGAVTSTVARPAAPARRGASRKRLVLMGVALFLAILAAVTVVEALAGKPLSDVVTGRGGAGTTVFGHTESPTSGPSPSPTSRSSSSSSSGSSSSSTSVTSSSSSSSAQLQTTPTPSGSNSSSSPQTSTSTSVPPSQTTSPTSPPGGGSGTSSPAGG